MSVNGPRMPKPLPPASTPPLIDWSDPGVIKPRWPDLPDVDPGPPVTAELGWTEQSGFSAGLVIGVIATTALIMATIAVATAFRRVL